MGTHERRARGRETDPVRGVTSVLPHREGVAMTAKMLLFLGSAVKRLVRAKGLLQ